MDFLIYVISAEIYGATYLYRFYIYHSLIFSKRLNGKHHFDCNLISLQFGNNIAARRLTGEVGLNRFLYRSK